MLLMAKTYINTIISMTNSIDGPKGKEYYIDLQDENNDMANIMFHFDGDKISNVDLAISPDDDPEHIYYAEHYVEDGRAMIVVTYSYGPKTEDEEIILKRDIGETLDVDTFLSASWEAIQGHIHSK